MEYELRRLYPFQRNQFKRLWQQGIQRHHLTRFDGTLANRMGHSLPGEYNWSENRAFEYGKAPKQCCVTNPLRQHTVRTFLAPAWVQIVCGEALRKGMRGKKHLLMEAALHERYDANAPQAGDACNKNQSYRTSDYQSIRLITVNIWLWRYINAVTGTLTNLLQDPDDWALATGTTLGQKYTWEAHQEATNGWR